MARALHRLSERKVQTAQGGLYCDGGGLYLQVTLGAEGRTSKSWLFRFATGEVKTSRTGKSYNAERTAGLGSYPATSLAEARRKAADARKQRAEGIDPIEAKRARQAAAALVQAKTMTFDECRDALSCRASGWLAKRQARHRVA